MPNYMRKTRKTIAIIFSYQRIVMLLESIK